MAVVVGAANVAVVVGVAEIIAAVALVAVVVLSFSMSSLLWLESLNLSSLFCVILLKRSLFL